MNKKSEVKTGETNYDFENDILILKIKEKKYFSSVEFDNLVVDLDMRGNVSGLRIFDASKVFKLPKSALENIKEFEVEIKVEDNTVCVNLWFNYSSQDNSLLTHGQNFVREAIAQELKNSELHCSIV